MAVVPDCARLAKVERGLRITARTRLQPLAPNHRLELKWWLNSGAISGVGNDFGFQLEIRV